MGSIRRSLAYSFADNYLAISLQLIASIVISRLLTPTEVGIFAIAAVFAALASTFRDFGVAEYLIQEKEVTREKIRSSFAANLIVSWAMALILAGTSDLAADFYRHPGVGEVMRIQAINFLLIPFGAVVLACFRRDLNYRPIFIANALSNLTSFAVSIGCAIYGLGYLSMAYGSLAGISITILVAFYFRPKSFPMTPSFGEFASVFRFGRHATGLFLFRQISKSLPEAVIGRALDMASVAFFSRATGLIEIFNRVVLRAVGSVYLPYFSDALRSGQPAAQIYGRALSLLSVTGWAFFAFVGANAESIIRVMFGPQWSASVPLAKVLCLEAAIAIPLFVAGELLVAAGLVAKANGLQLIQTTLRVAGLFLFLPYGLIGVCWGLVAASFLGLVLCARTLRNELRIPVLSSMRAIGPDFIVAGAILALNLGLNATVGMDLAHPILGLVVNGVATAVVFLFFLRAFGHLAWQELTTLAKKWTGR